MREDKLTIEQAEDLAQHFLGSEWHASLWGSAHCLIGPKMAQFVDTSWRDVFRASGHPLPSRPRFVQIGHRVMYGGNCIYTLESKNAANIRTRALNRILKRRDRGQPYCM